MQKSKNKLRHCFSIHGHYPSTSANTHTHTHTHTHTKAVLSGRGDRLCLSASSCSGVMDADEKILPAATLAVSPFLLLHALVRVCVCVCVSVSECVGERVSVGVCL